MALASELKVYRDTYKLVALLIEVTGNFSRRHKYTLGQKIYDTSLELFGYIQLANMFKQNRVAHLNGFIVKFELLKTLIRLGGEKHCISIGQQANIAQLTESIGRQVSAWKNAPLPAQ